MPTTFSHGQEMLSFDYEIERLAFFADAMVNASEAKHRKMASEVFESEFELYIKQDRSFSLPLSEIKWISVLQPEDQSFRLISWQYTPEENKYRYTGFLQTSSGKLFKLSDEEQEIPDLEYESIDPDFWYGALYYEMEPLNIEGCQSCYLLFGYQQRDQFLKTRFVELLDLSTGAPNFGKSIFVKEIENSRPETRNRILLNYSADASITLNFNPEMQMVVFDHLVARQGRIPGQGMTLYPDGSYEAYVLSEGKFYYKERVFEDNVEENIISTPVLGDKDKDLFGNSKSAKKKKKKKDN